MAGDLFLGILLGLTLHYEFWGARERPLCKMFLRSQRSPWTVRPGQANAGFNLHVLILGRGHRASRHLTG